MSGLVATGRLAGDDVHAVIGVDECDETHQSGELLVVVVLGRVRPDLVAGATGGIGDAGALLGELERCPLGREAPTRPESACSN